MPIGQIFKSSAHNENHNSPIKKLMNRPFCGALSSHSARRCLLCAFAGSAERFVKKVATSPTSTRSWVMRRSVQHNRQRQHGAIGLDALFSNTTASSTRPTEVKRSRATQPANSNTASGVAALLSNTTGNDNTAIGGGALQAHNGSFNTATGLLRSVQHNRLQ